MIRTLVSNDYPWVLALWLQAGASPVDERTLSAMLERTGSFALVEADEEARIRGVVIGTFDGRRGWLHRLAVSPSVRRSGLATRLIAEAESRLARAGAERVNVLALPDNEAAGFLWSRLGYDSQPDIILSKAVQRRD